MLMSQLAGAQEEGWDVYMAQFDDGPGTIVIHKGLAASAPQEERPFVVVAGVTYEDCEDDGFPSMEQFDILYEIEDAVELAIMGHCSATLAGTFTHQCERLNYLYVNDTAGLREKIKEVYATNFTGYEYYLNIQEDKAWAYYFEFLYPSEEIEASMSNQSSSNQDVLSHLIEAGDDLSKERQVDHWIFFKDKKSRIVFRDFAVSEGFGIESEYKVKVEEYSLALQISRIDQVDLASISAITEMLESKAKALDAEYDGWETFVVTE